MDEDQLSLRQADQGTLTNRGNLSPGGKGVVQTTALTGNLVQTSSGKISVDVDRTAGQADRINVSGTAQLAVSDRDLTGRNLDLVAEFDRLLGPRASPWRGTGWGSCISQRGWNSARSR
jgi:hypothetical protein